MAVQTWPCDHDRVLIYKILLPAEWAALVADNWFDGSPLDQASGFVHCSSRAQVGSTARRFFDSDQHLVVVSLDAEALGGAIRWEPAETGEQFPHLYGRIPRSAVVAVYPVPGPAYVDVMVPNE
jgi:uncharacterized protein (DUF952 family)